MRTETFPDGTVPRSVGRVLDLLEAVLVLQPCTLSSAADACDLTPSTALRHLRALEARGYLTRDGSGEFSAGPSLVRIAASLRDLTSLDPLITMAQPYLDELATQTGESTYLALCDHRMATYVAAAESHRAIRHVGWVGQTIPLAGTAVGAAIRTPGVVACRTGAVEADISAVSLSVGHKHPTMAISVIGPEHRLDAEAIDVISTALDHAVSSLERSIGLKEPRVVS
ncbi:MAG: IclR family transcriptional regulator [Acidimicrobiales bacterium]